MIARVSSHDSRGPEGDLRFDYILVGGGLQSGLIALALAHHQPQARLLLLEQHGELGGNHTWSFHGSDIPTACASWAERLVEYRWPSYMISVGGRVRTVGIPYRTCSSAHFANVLKPVMQHPNRSLLTHATVVEVGPQSVALSDGRWFAGSVVLDNRGPLSQTAETLAGGFQKFWGFELELGADWPHANPIVMDDAIDQADGFRFIYTLPLERRRVLVEDTRFSNSPRIEREECLQEVRAYVRAHGFEQWRIVREEHGILPMPTAGALPGSGLPMLAGGYRGGWFHAATGYSFPLAIRFAETVATTPADRLPAAIRDLAQENTWRGRYARFLNRLLFELVKPQTRYQIFRRFYRVLSEPAIARFYSHRFSFVDAFRIVVGVPPRGLRPLNFFRSYWRLPSHSQRLPSTNQPLKVLG